MHPYINEGVSFWPARRTKRITEKSRSRFSSPSRYRVRCTASHFDVTNARVSSQATSTSSLSRPIYRDESDESRDTLAYGKTIRNSGRGLRKSTSTLCSPHRQFSPRKSEANRRHCPRASRPRIPVRACVRASRGTKSALRRSALASTRVIYNWFTAR
jgi:hypothetical protein